MATKRKRCHYYNRRCGCMMVNVFGTEPCPKNTTNDCFIIPKKVKPKMVQRVVKAYIYPDALFINTPYKFAGERGTVPCTITYMEPKK